MGIHAIRWAAVLGLAPLAYAAVPPPDAWVPARWPFADARSLDLLEGSPVNCLLLAQPAPELAAAAAQRGLATLAVLDPSPDAPAAAPPGHRRRSYRPRARRRFSGRYRRRCAPGRRRRSRDRTRIPQPHAPRIGLARLRHHPGRLGRHCRR